MNSRFPALLLVPALVVSCSNTSALCSAESCAGCCGTDGRCQPGITALQCGGAGAKCAACSAGQVCTGTLCVFAPPTGDAGGGSGNDGGPDAGTPDAGSDGGNATDSGFDAGPPTSCLGLADGTACAFGAKSPGPDGVLRELLGACCGATCVDPSQDPQNCHACGTVCSGVCSSNAKYELQPYCLTPNSQFGVLPCSPGSGFLPTNCGTDAGSLGVCCYVPFTASDVVCSTLADDPKNCGACGVRCPAGQTCSGGQCAGAVAPCLVGHIGEFCDVDAGPQNLCCSGGGCTNILTDANNCGYCGIVCAAGQACFDGQCLNTACTAQTEARPCALFDGGAGECCAQVCQDIETDPTNCGGCGRQCSVTETCRFGYCGFDTCSVSMQGDTCHLAPGVKGLCCAMGCVDSSSDPLNCGGCNLPCPNGVGCSNGVCH